MRNKLICCIPLALCVVCLFGCASDASRLPTGAKPEMTPSTQQHRPAAEADVPTVPTAALETAVADEPAPQAPAQNEPVQSTPAEYPNISPTPVQETPTPVEPTPTIPTEPTPAPTTDTYSVEEAMRLGNGYARAQYGVAIDTAMTTANSGYYPGTVESAAWLAANGGQSALNEAVCRNVDATFANLAARDGAEAVSTYATFSCTVRYDAGDYVIVILYG